MSCDEIPAPAALIRDFANTYEAGTDTDQLTDLAALRHWLCEHGLSAANARGTSADLQTARQLRQALRAAMDPQAEPATMPEFELRTTWTEDGAVLEPADGGLRGGLAQVGIAAVRCTTDQSWPRMKLCAAQSCRWAFYDTTRNRSRAWCSMDVCGNREKTKAYRARHR